MKIAKGDTIKIEYTGRLDDGTIFDSSEQHDELLEFTVGEGQLIAGFENAVLGMEVGEEKEIVLQPLEAYGERKRELFAKIPREKLPAQPAPQIGMMLYVNQPSGQRLEVPIVEVAISDVTIDLNHPLAGKVLHFKIKVVEKV